MKIAALLDSVSRANGGIFHAERDRSRALARIAGVSVEVLGLEDEFSASDLASWQPLKPRVFPVAGPKALGYSPLFKLALLRTDADLVHAAGLWKYPSVAALAWHRETRKPHLISPHGMLDEWALRHSGWKKKIAAALYERAHLGSAACLHALCPAEVDSIRAYGLRNPVCIIPNGVELPATSSGPRRAPGKRVLLYLGRLHPKKGLPALIQAWSRMTGEWVLVIAGWDQGAHQADLQRQATELCLKWSKGFYRVDDEATIFFAGPQFDQDKAACYRNCDAFILPSLSEGLPLVILEAWAHGKPVLMTPQCHLPEGFERHAAIRIEPNADGIHLGLRNLFAMSAADRETMGKNGLSLVKERYLWPAIAAEMKSVYDWVLGGGSSPGCVKS